MGRVIFNEGPGRAWTNDTGKVAYQFVASLVNTCGTCLQYHMAISSWWPIPLHPGCRCTQRVIAPGAVAAPFADFRAILDGLPADQRRAAIGASNYRLLRRGVISWDDVVTPSRVRTLEEVVARGRIDVATMERAGVRRPVAARAFAAVNTPEHRLIEARRRALISNLTSAGLSKGQIRAAFGERLAKSASLTTIGPTRGGSFRLPVTPVEKLIPLLGLDPLRTRAALSKPRPKRETPGQLVRRAVDTLESRGQRTEVLSGAEFKARFHLDGTAAYDHRSGVVFINRDARNWHDARYRRNVEKMKFFVDASPEGTAIHEFGHAEHHRELVRRHGEEAGTDRLREMINDDFRDDDALKQRVKKLVSRDAAMDRAEFVAEVFAGLSAGRDYPDDLMRLYDSLGGPRP